MEETPNTLAPHLPTVVAIAGTAFVATAFTFWLGEAMACGVACRPGDVLDAERIRAAYQSIPAGSFRAIRVSGTIAELVLCLLSIALVLATRESATGLRYFLWLTMTLSGISAGSYMVLSLILNRGDWSWLVFGLDAAVLWKVMLTLVGLGVLAVVYKVSKRRLEVFVGRTDERLKLLNTLTITPVLTCFALALLVDLISSEPPPSYLLTPLGALALTAAMLVFPWRSKLPISTTPHKPSQVEFSVAWLLTGVASMALCVGTFVELS